jgi:hypothetical protein
MAWYTRSMIVLGDVRGYVVALLLRGPMIVLGDVRGYVRRDITVLCVTVSFSIWFPY